MLKEVETNNMREILLIGDIGRAFLDAETIKELPCQSCASVLDGVDAAAKKQFIAIGVVMAGLSSKLDSALKALREANSDAEIILLARMFEEPAAMKMVSSAYNGRSLADDYLICPIQVNKFLEFVEPTQVQRAQQTSRSPAKDYTTEKKIAELERLATEDELTGLKNRRYIWEFSRQIIEHARVEKGRVTLLVFDIDNFKHYNDVYGHSAGDEVLRQAAVLMRRCCRSHDIVGRIGGDEFAVVFWVDPQLKVADSQTERRSAIADHPKEVVFIANRFRKELEDTELHLLGPEAKGVLTISGGLASFPRDGSTVKELFAQADKALLEAKRSGKNRIYLVGKPNSDIADV
jgi:diguanylate cyclase (GGDEF)-like protein